MTEIFTPDNLLAGHFPLVTEPVTVLSGQNLVRGTVLGRVTASSKCVIVNSGNADGSESAYAVLSEDLDATSADKVGVAYLTGEFNEDSLVFGGTDDTDTHRGACRALSIFFKKPVSA